MIGGRAPSVPRILVIGTGGTIAARTAMSGPRRYAYGQVGVGSLIAKAQVGAFADIRSEQVADIGSQDMNTAVWHRLHDRLVAALSDKATDGVVITHGTDTLEETAYFLDLVLPVGPPVVLVGAMRPSNADDADGPSNLADAIRLAALPAARDRGVLVVMGGAIHGARAATKVSNAPPEAFRSFPERPLGAVSASGAFFFAPPPGAVRRDRYRMFDPGAEPRVDVVYAHAGMDSSIVSALARRKTAGIVLAGLGNGNAPAAVLDRLGAAARDGIAVVRSTRLGEGRVDRNVEVDDDALGFLAAGALNPQKSRILLQLLIANSIDSLGQRQRAFDLG
ncbi:MAG: asparaginase [Rhizomicrobium sp.]